MSSLTLKFLIMGLFSIFTGAVFAKEPAATPCLDTKALPSGLKSLSISDLKGIQAKMKTSNYLSVDFVQSIYTPLRNKTRAVDGHAYFAKPSKVRWNKTKPKEEIFFNGKDLYMYRPDEKSAFKFSAKGSQASEFEKLTTLVLNLDQLLDRYELMTALEDKNAKMVYLSLAPKKDAADLVEVVTELNVATNMVSRVCLAYKDKKTISYAFTNASIKPVDDKMFNFEVPKGVKLDVYD